MYTQNAYYVLSSKFCTISIFNIDRICMQPYFVFKIRCISSIVLLEHDTAEG